MAILTLSKLRLYLDTTIPSYVFAVDSVEKMEITKRFMGLAHSPRYEMMISDVVLRELHAASHPKRLLLLEQVKNMQVLPLTTEAEKLADAYIRHAILPRGSWDDALHVAIATLNYADALVSWNFGHLVNIRRIKLINELHANENLPRIDIVTPEEVVNL